jgi:hypothetical protein
MGQPHIDVRMDQLVRHRVEGLVDFNLMVWMDVGGFPSGVLQRSSATVVLEQLPTRLSDLRTGRLLRSASKTPLAAFSSAKRRSRHLHAAKMSVASSFPRH